MRPVFKSLSAAGLALALFTVGPAWADRANNEQHSFGPGSPTVFGPGGQQQPRFMSDPRSNSYDDGGFFNFFFGNLSHSQNPDINIDPQVDTGPDVSIYTYYADPLVALGRNDLKRPVALASPVFSAIRREGVQPVLPDQGAKGIEGRLAEAVFERLRGMDSAVRVTEPQNTAIVDFYKKRGFAPVWTTLQGLTPKAHELLDRFARANEEGLERRDFLPPAMAGFDGSLKAADNQMSGLSDAELGLTAMALRYAMQASGGRVVPDRLSGYEDLTPLVVDPAAALKALADAEHPAAYLAGLEPVHPAYAALKAALKPLLDEHIKEKIIAPVATGPVIHPGDSDDRIPAIRARLIDLGKLAAPAAEVQAAADTTADPTETSAISNGDNVDMNGTRVTVTLTTSEGINATQVAAQGGPVPIVQQSTLATGDTVYDDKLKTAVLSLQAAAGLKADGIIGNRTVAALNAGLAQNSKAMQKAKIRLAMERLRWLPRNFGQRYVLANQAAFELYMVENGHQIWQTKVIVGKPDHQTTEFIDQMETVVFNPYWGVPQSIIIHEMLPHLRQDPSYLDRQGFEVTDLSGNHISSSSVDWWQFSDKVPLNVRQPPGNDNALGRIKFLFPNKHSIYMHDTPTKPLFAKPSRAYSHGCVRVQDPRRFAELLLGWSSQQVASAVDSGQNQDVNLAQKVPVYLTYFTAWPDAEGNVKFYDDVYGRDQLMETAEQTTDDSLHATQ